MEGPLSLIQVLDERITHCILLIDRCRAVEDIKTGSREIVEFFFHKVIWVPPLPWWQYLLQVLLPHIGLCVPQISSTVYSLNLEQTSL